MLWQLAPVGIGWLSAAWLVSMAMRRLRYSPQTAISPAGQARSLDARVWDDYRADRISIVSALLRTDALFTARIAEITDWDALDWTTSPLAPTKGSWQWDDDQLVRDDRYVVGPTVESMSNALAASFGLPHYSGRIEDRSAAALHAAHVGHSEQYMRQLHIEEQAQAAETIMRMRAERDAIGKPILMLPDWNVEAINPSTGLGYLQSPDEG